VFEALDHGQSIPGALIFRRRGRVNDTDGPDAGSSSAIDPVLRLGDRIERLDLTGDAKWGTITEEADDGWLVLDNAGNVSREASSNLRRATKANDGPPLGRASPRPSSRDAVLDLIQRARGG
jgi:hypothetical protein